MFCRRNFLLSLFVLFNAATLHAGTMGPAPSFEGLSQGAGAGYVNTNSSKWTDVSVVSPFLTVTEYFRGDDIKNSFSPIVDASYFYALENQWLVGLKGLYKYLGVPHSKIAWSGTFQNGTYQQADFHTKVIQKFFLTVDGAYQLIPNWMVYLEFWPAVKPYGGARGNLGLNIYCLTVSLSTFHII